MWVGFKGLCTCQAGKTRGQKMQYITEGGALNTGFRRLQKCQTKEANTSEILIGKQIPR